MFRFYEFSSPGLGWGEADGLVQTPGALQDTVPIALGLETRVGSVSLSIPHPNPDTTFHLHVEDCLLVPILPTVPDRQGVIAPL